jgi:mono/diheme cytochrome c family protein
MLANFYQWLLIIFSIIVTVLLGVFFYFELFPQYKEFQNTYIELEDFRSAETGIKVPEFKKEVKQIVLPQKKGPEEVDRCVSCHVAVKFEHFSPTKVSLDLNGNERFSSFGKPILEENENYIWKLLDEKISFLKENQKFKEAKKLESLQTIKIDGVDVDVTKALRMHPLIGNETRPFENHPIEEYGCISCHSGNGRGLTFDKAHGPVYDGEYEAAHMGHHKKFIDEDPNNDPLFSKAYNSKPGHKLLFQTTPILVGTLIESSCVQCHENEKEKLKSSLEGIGFEKESRIHNKEFLLSQLEKEEDRLTGNLKIIHRLKKQGLSGVYEWLKELQEDYKIPVKENQKYREQEEYLKKLEASYQGKGSLNDFVLIALKKNCEEIIGSQEILEELYKDLNFSYKREKEFIQRVLKEKKDLIKGSFGEKITVLKNINPGLSAVEKANKSMEYLFQDSRFLNSSWNFLTGEFEGFGKGKELYISQACYACHEIKGMSRGKVGPELTSIGNYYPWYIKESIVWPQSNLKTSTMPNFRLDHEDVEGVMTFLMAQKGKTQVQTSVQYSKDVKQWETNTVMPWEKPITPSNIENVDLGLEIFATQGCASCHELKGISGPAVFSNKEDIDKQKKWFKKVFPGNISGKDLTKVIEQEKDTIDLWLSLDKGKGLLSKIEALNPGLLMSYNAAFKFAFRSQNKSHLEDKQYLKTWKDRVLLVRMMYIQQYGVGRDVGPRLHWSGVYRDKEWLMGHFKNPNSHTAKSIMPVMPFDDSKFYNLTNMLQVIGRENRDQLRSYWELEGFDPEKAYLMHCASCHGDKLHGGGPVAEMIYPVPKNLKNSTFLRELTKERAVESILHGVQGTPMPPWGEVASSEDKGKPVLTKQEAKQIVDWLFRQLPGNRVVQDADIDKWNYEPEDVIEEIEKARIILNEDNKVSYKDSVAEDIKNLTNVLSCGVGNNFQTSTTSNKTLTDKDFVDVFDQRVSLTGSLEESSYFIKDKYYTPQNIEDGKELFIINCSHCHGKVAMGDGERASSILDAKPRMLVNLPWLRTRDDLRLLRSIKYGVPGTAMTFWGDKTNIVQRIQMVMYIRSLTQEKMFREELNHALYKSFEEQLVELIKIQGEIEEKQESFAKNYEDEEFNEEFFPTSIESTKEDWKKLERLADLKEVLVLYNQVSKGFDSIKDLFIKERNNLQKVALALLDFNSPESFEEYLSIIDSFSCSFIFDEGVVYKCSNKFSQVRENINNIKNRIDLAIEQAAEQEVLIKGKFADSQRTQTLKELRKDLRSLYLMKNFVVGETNKIIDLHNEREALFEELNKKIKQLKSKRDLKLEPSAINSKAA